MNRYLLLLNLSFTSASIYGSTPHADLQTKFAVWSKNMISRIAYTQEAFPRENYIQNYLDDHASTEPEHDAYKPEHYTPHGRPLIMAKKHEQTVINSQDITLNSINHATHFPHA